MSDKSTMRTNELELPSNATPRVFLTDMMRKTQEKPLTKEKPLTHWRKKLVYSPPRTWNWEYPDGNWQLSTSKNRRTADLNAQCPIILNACSRRMNSSSTARKRWINWERDCGIVYFAHIALKGPSFTAYTTCGLIWDAISVRGTSNTQTVRKNSLLTKT